MPIPTPKMLADALQHRDPFDVQLPGGRPPGQGRERLGAVMVPLSWREDDLFCILTVRPTNMRKHAGEVCFPGGRPDPDDRDLQHTAAREAQEELGIEDAKFLGELSRMPVYTSSYRICPFVAAISAQSLRPNPAEVAQVVELSITELLQRPHFDGIPWPLGDFAQMAPVFDVGRGAPKSDDVSKPMFGATAYSFYELLMVLAPLYGVPLPPFLAGRYEWSQLITRHS